MKKNKCFFQDFLFENMPVDEHDYPDIAIQFCDSFYENHISADVVVSFDRLLRMTKQDEWTSLLSSVNDKTVLIKDDVPIINPEVKTLKEFYLGVYYYHFHKHSKGCMVARNSIC